MMNTTAETVEMKSGHYMLYVEDLHGTAKMPFPHLHGDDQKQQVEETLL